MKTFRLLILDDGPWRALSAGMQPTRDLNRVMPFGGDNELIQLAESIAKSAEELQIRFECCIAGHLHPLPDRPLFWLGNPPTHQFTGWESFLPEFDVAIIDFRGIVGDAKLRREELPPGSNLSDEEFRQLTSSSDNDPVGAAFFLKHHHLGSFENHRAVFLLSQTDIEQHECLSKTVNQLAVARGSLPWIIKYEPNRTNLVRINNLASIFLEEHQKGFSALEHSDLIEFPAHHDKPVVILGETGTGKEWTARRIHLRWAAERIANEPQPASGTEYWDNFKVVHCAALSPALARSELFGHVKGSFTDALDHNMGLVLAACGCTPPKSGGRSPGMTEAEVRDSLQRFTELARLCDAVPPSDPAARLKFLQELLPKLHDVLELGDNRTLARFIDEALRKVRDRMEGRDWADDFGSTLAVKNQALFDVKGDDLRFLPPRAVGTLFLDEFGDLHPEIQTLLLRFMQNGEIQPIGFKGRIYDLKLRIIVATSDPAVARFYGCDDLVSSWRSDEERRALRQDLLFRLKQGPAIRVRGVTADNFQQEFEHILRHAGHPELWDKEGKEAALALLRQVLTDLAKVGARNDGSVPAFGHRREIRHLIESAELWVRSARTRGMRHVRHTDLVMADAVHAVWKSSVLQLILRHQAPPVTGPAPETSALSAALKTRIEKCLKGIGTWDGTLKSLDEHRSRLAAKKWDSLCEALRGALLPIKSNKLKDQIVSEAFLPGEFRTANCYKSFMDHFDPKKRPAALAAKKQG